MAEDREFETGKILVGSCLDRLKELEDASVDSIVTDPPYELGFMGKKWDASGIAYNVELWAECLRVLKPGGHLLAFGGTRTYHRMAVAIEDAGFEIRDSIHWVYGSGFPKSHNISIALDKEAGVMKHRGKRASFAGNITQGQNVEPAKAMPAHEPITDAAKQWEGWGTALKPAHEPVVLARKPLDGTVAANVKEHGTGALNIDGCRIGRAEGDVSTGGYGNGGIGMGGVGEGNGEGKNAEWVQSTEGRWPANIIFDEAAGAELDAQSGIRTPGHWTQTKTTGFGEFGGGTSEYHGTGPKSEAGGASRFFYCPKPSKKERNAGLDGLPEKIGAGKGNGLARKCATCGAAVVGGCDCPDRTFVNPARQNFHPTVKPVELMRYLCRLVTPPNGTVLDPFLGSGTTAVAAILEGFTWVGCEMTDDYLPIIEGRVANAEKKEEEEA